MKEYTYKLCLFLVVVGSWVFGDTNTIELDLFGDRVDSSPSTPVVTTEEVAFDDFQLRSAVVENMNEFKVFYEQDKHKHENEEIKSFLENVVTNPISEEEWEFVFRYFTRTYGLRIQGDPALTLLIAGLYGESSGIQEEALNKLMWSVGHETKAKYSEEIKKALGTCPSRIEEKYLIAKCDLTAAEKHRLLQSVDSSDKLLAALCGDKKAEGVIIQLFKDASDYEGKKRWVRPLAFIGTPACANALVEGLDSPVFGLVRDNSGFDKYYFIREPILKELGLIFENELVFQVVWNTKWADDEYPERVDRWVMENYGHAAWSYSNIFFQVDAFLSPCDLQALEQAPSPSQTVSEEQEGSATLSEIRLPSNTVWTVDLGSDVLMEFMPIPAGSFTMGSYHYRVHEMPEHTVTISQPFWMAKTEVTQEQFQRIMGINTSRFKGNQRPADALSQQEAIEFCKKLTKRERLAGRLPQGYEYVLPSEAQWEYACRTGMNKDHIENTDAYVWPSHGDNPTHPVGQKQANKWGLYDMLGNVAEWCSDCYHDTYMGAPVDGSGWGVSESGSSCVKVAVARGGVTAYTTQMYPPTFRIKAFVENVSGYDCFGFRPVISEIKRSE